jgi:gamma-glutamyltranspeptidase / glutathione hydrolase
MLTHGVVVAGDPQSAEAGARCLREGGNAVDAALGAGFATFVCELPLASPLGGGALVASVAGADPLALEFFARTPGLGAARPPRLDFEDVEVDFGATRQIFHIGRASAAVPLALPGLLEAHRRWGRLPLERVVEPAVELARRGYVLSSGVAYVFKLLEPIVTRTPGVSVLFSDAEGRLATAGARLFNPDLGDSLERVARHPAATRELFAALGHAFSPAEGGLMTERDVTELEPVVAPPVRVEHRGWELHTMPAPSSGGVLVALGLRLLEGAAERAAFLSPEHVLELARVQDVLLDLRDADFDERCRSPEFVSELLDERRIAELGARLAERGAAPLNRLGSTTHVSALDEHGGAASLTLTNGEGSGYVVSGTGMHANNLLGEEDLHPRGFHRDAPGTRLVTMMAPSVLRRADGRTVALGSGGSNRLRNAILLTLSHLIDHQVSAAEAVAAPRLHLEATASGVRELALERTGLGEEAIAALGRAYPDPIVFEQPNMFFGGVHVALRNGGAFEGAGDARRGGAVAVV